MGTSMLDMMPLSLNDGSLDIAAYAEEWAQKIYQFYNDPTTYPNRCLSSLNDDYTKLGCFLTLDWSGAARHARTAATLANWKLSTRVYPSNSLDSVYQNMLNQNNEQFLRTFETLMNTIQTNPFRNSFSQFAFYYMRFIGNIRQTGNINSVLAGRIGTRAKYIYVTFLDASLVSNAQRGAYINYQRGLSSTLRKRQQVPQITTDAIYFSYTSKLYLCKTSDAIAWGCLEGVAYVCELGATNCDAAWAQIPSALQPTYRTLARGVCLSYRSFFPVACTRYGS